LDSSAEKRLTVKGYLHFICRLPVEMDLANLEIQCASGGESIAASCTSFVSQNISVI
jgi:hypothetical protein